MSNSKNWLVLISGDADAKNSAVKAGIDLALAAGAFGQNVKLVFAGKGIKLLGPEPGENPDLHKLIGAAPFYDIKEVHVFATTSVPLEEIYRKDLPITHLSQSDWHIANAEADVVINY